LEVQRKGIRVASEGFRDFLLDIVFKFAYHVAFSVKFKRPYWLLSRSPTWENSAPATPEACLRGSIMAG
jgi:hypothetical protein